MTERKQKDGSRVEWNKAAALPRSVPPFSGYMQQEGAAGDGLLVALETAEIEFVTPVLEAQSDE